MRMAAFPVGAAMAILNSLDCKLNSAMSFDMVVVLPVPGPPEIIEN